MFAPIYNKVADLIRADISSQMWADKLPGVIKLAEHYEAAPKTISKAVNLLADEGLVTTHGTRGTFITQTETKRPRYGTLGIIGLRTHMRYRDDVIAAEKVAQSMGYDLIILGVPSQLGSLTNNLHKMPVDGLIFTNSTLNQEITVSLRQNNMPFVSANRIDDIPGINWVDYDNEAGLEMALDYLLRRGHQRIAYIAFKYALEEHQRRTHEVYKRVMEQNSWYDPALWIADTTLLEYAQNFDIWDDAPIDYGRKMMRNLLNTPHLPTAAFFGDLRIAQGAHEVLAQTAGISDSDFTIFPRAQNGERSRESQFDHIAADDTARMKRAVEMLIDMTVRTTEAPVQKLIPFKLVEAKTKPQKTEDAKENDLVLTAT